VWIALLLALAALAAAPLAAAPCRAGEMVAQVIESAALGRSWNISVYRPDGYAAGAVHYPVLYFLPGHSARRGDWVNLTLPALADAAIAAGRMPPALVVVPELGTSWGVDRHEAMQTALIDELLPTIERDWRVLPGRTGRALGGISAGGYAALRLAMLHPHRFAALAILSPAIYVPEPPLVSAARKFGTFGSDRVPDFDPAVWQALNYPALLPAYRAKDTPVPLFTASGDTDHLGTQLESARLAETWRHMRMPVEQRLVQGGHTYAVWRELLPDALAFAFRFTAPPAP
jgi:enterochelin esterase-like enzyme